MMGTIVRLYPAQEPMRAEKEFANLQAKAALLGATLHWIEDDRGAAKFIVSKWNVTRQLDSFEQVSVWLDRLAGRYSS